MINTITSIRSNIKLYKQCVTLINEIYWLSSCKLAIKPKYRVMSLINVLFQCKLCLNACSLTNDRTVLCINNSTNSFNSPVITHYQVTRKQRDILIHNVYLKMFQISYRPNIFQNYWMPKRVFNTVIINVLLRMYTPTVKFGFSSLLSISNRIQL